MWAKYHGNFLSIKRNVVSHEAGNVLFKAHHYTIFFECFHLLNRLDVLYGCKQ